MLSQTTFEILNSVVSDSLGIYPEGGVVYEYRFGKNLAHFIIPTEYKELSKGWSSTSRRSLTRKEVRELQLFFDGAFGNRITRHDKISYSSQSLVDKLLLQLELDTKHDHVVVRVLERDESEMGDKVEIVMTQDNDFFVLLLMWTVD